MRITYIFGICALLTASPDPQLFAPATKTPEVAMVDRAIEVAGGEEALKKNPAFSWTAEAKVRAEGREVTIVGKWLLDPPDRAIVETRPVSEPPDALRTLVISGKSGYAIVKDEREQISPEVLENERDQFYLYSLIRLLSLRDYGVRLEALPKSDDGLDGLKVSRPERPDVEMFFDPESGRLRRLSLETLDPVTNTRRRQNARLDGEVVSKGVRWFKQLSLTWENEPYFDLTITTLDVLPGLADPRLR
jgi:hypothetical protein